MIRFIMSEKLKYKRTFIKKMMFLSPILFMMVVFLMSFYLPKTYITKSNFILMCSFNWWTLFLPLTLALFVSLIGAQEKKVANYKNLICHGIKPSSIWISKIMIVSYYTLMVTLELGVIVILTGLLLTKKTDVYSVFISVFIVWISLLFLIPLYLFFIAKTGIISNMIIGFIGMLFSAYFADGEKWIFVPFSYGLRMLSPILKVHPNSVPLKPGDYLLDFSVVPLGLTVSIFVFVFCVVVTLFGFRMVVKE